jgi:choline dehydrogenase
VRSDISDADVVIVGAGTAGCVLAARLSQQVDCKVVLFEAGRDYPSLDELPDEIRLGCVSELDPTTAAHKWVREIVVARGVAPSYMVGGSVTGGSSAINGQVFLRGTPEDYDGWAAAGNPLWSFEQVLPFFRRTETDLDFDDEYHGRTGPIPVRRFRENELLAPQLSFAAACRAKGFPSCADHNNPTSVGIGSNPCNNVDGVRFSTALCYLAPARHRENLRILSEAHVDRIRFDGCRAIGVDATRAGSTVRVDAGEIIICAGAIGSPLLLQTSGVGPATLLDSLGVPVVCDQPGVGVSLQDHPSVRTTWRASPSFTADPTAMRSQMCLRYSSGRTGARNDMKVSCASYSWVVEGGIDLFVGLQANQARGFVRARTSSAMGPASIEMSFLDHADDRNRLREAVRFAIDLGHSAEFAPIIAGRIFPSADDLASDLTLDAFICRNLRSAMHASGTCAMGPESDPSAVVDQLGVIRGTENLRVVDASIMPVLVSNNPQATIVMMAERVADLIQSH